MSQDLVEQKSLLLSLTKSYEDLLKESISEEERSILDRISQKLNDISKRLEAAVSSAGEEGQQGAPDVDAQKRKAGRLDKLKAMTSLIADRMASLKAAR